MSPDAGSLTNQPSVVETARLCVTVAFDACLVGLVT